LSTADTPVTPVGIWNFMLFVGEPSQPCSTLNCTVPAVPACIAIGSGSTCADAIPPARSTRAVVVAVVTRACLNKVIVIAVVVAP
jgi:hypothetical protein